MKGPKVRSEGLARAHVVAVNRPGMRGKTVARIIRESIAEARLLSSVIDLREASGRVDLAWVVGL